MIFKKKGFFSVLTKWSLKHCRSQSRLSKQKKGWVSCFFVYLNNLHDHVFLLRMIDICRSGHAEAWPEIFSNYVCFSKDWRNFWAYNFCHLLRNTIHYTHYNIQKFRSKMKGRDENLGTRGSWNFTFKKSHSDQHHII